VGDESIWKKEISFGRKRKDEPSEPKSESESIWKKELSLGRKKKAEEPTNEPEAVGPVVDEEPAASEETWTRAVSFGRKSQTEPVPGAPAEGAAPLVEADPDDLGTESHDFGADSGSDPVTISEQSTTPVETWTRAVSFGRQSDPEPAADEATPVVEDAQPDPVVDEPAPVVELPVAAVEPEPVAVEPVAVPEPEPVAIEPVAVVEPEPEVTHPMAEEAAWTKEVSFSRAPEQPEAPEPEPVVVEPVAVPDPAQGVHAPVTAEELQHLDEPEPEKKLPFWKKEIGGKKKASAETPTVAVAAVAADDGEPEQKVPFWKKEIGGKKKAKAESAPVPTEAVATAEVAVDHEEPEEKVPFWKKDIGGKKKPKAERAQKQPKAKKEKAPKEPKQRKQKRPKVKAARGSRGAKRITGLKIGASQLAAARVANNGSAELLQIARTPLEAGIVVGGELRDPDALAEALKHFFAQNDLPKKGVRLGIANNRIGVRTFDIGGIADEKQLANAIRFRAQETLPIPIDEAVLDYQVLGDSTDQHGEPTKRVLLVVAYRELIDRYLDACKKAGISLVGIDLEAFALLRALQPPQDGVGGDAAAALVAVAIGHDRSTFAVSDGRICEFTRVLEWGGSALNVAIARALDAAPSEVDGFKRALALTDEMVPEGLTQEQATKARDAMRRAIQTFARELVSSLQYYQNQPGSLGIGEIVLTGGTAHLSGLAGELERLIGVRVRVGDPLARMKVSKKVGEAEQVGSLAVAIGLGIED
jgi:type IV pilus assembly protein PilM